MFGGLFVQQIPSLLSVYSISSAMASKAKTRPLQISAVLIVLFSLAISATARPYKTLFIFYYSFSLPQRLDNLHPSSSGFVNIRYLRPVRSNPSYIIHDNRNKATLSTLLRDRTFSTFEKDQAVESRDVREKDASSSSSQFEHFGLSSYDVSSLRDRTKDILSVVVALLFGVGCGSLTATAMYFVWSFFSDRFEYGGPYGGFVNNDHENGDEIESPKKMGYVTIPAADSVAARPPAKEVV